MHFLFPFGAVVAQLSGICYHQNMAAVMECHPQDLWPGSTDGPLSPHMTCEIHHRRFCLTFHIELLPQPWWARETGTLPWSWDFSKEAFLILLPKAFSAVWTLPPFFTFHFPSSTSQILFHESLSLKPQYPLGYFVSLPRCLLLSSIT